ncbi:division plane positioning ATPase MipZ [Aquibaculum arenosum]|uniref:Division plane positioning ATPase MipZ n=1 Tax=Aquibaculum arenosum TaxID=3032591 RepID=A0ABT5YIG2_9PROT|nr:division plane positioning ATPase MipZ [Fodinicurvata sp. CAU 1616]MDF2094687.1 division plane positioning ATPase MipZ [Fodinicurvata sp. CAU 1616]
MSIAPNPSIAPAGRSQPPARVIVLGNEKGGSGKSTTAMHLVVALLRTGRSVGVIDLDARQGTLSRYVENRRSFCEREGLSLPQPELRKVERSQAADRDAAEAEEAGALEQARMDLADCDYLVIDTPGSDSHLSRLGHTLADILISPMNDSFVDLDLLARIDPDGQKILGPSVYAQMVWEQRLRRAKAGGRPIDWVVMRNRLSHLDARNKQRVGALLTQLAKRINFRLAPGFGERVIFRELFPKGLTLLDLKESGEGLTMSHIAARQEVRELLRTIGLGSEETGAEEAFARAAVL